MERLHSHLLWVGLACHIVGFDTLFMQARWRAAGHATELHVWPEAPHGFLSLPMSVTSPALDAEHEFLRRTLGLD